MTKLKVNLDKLDAYAKAIQTKSTEFESLKTKMAGTLEGISAWQGIDADTFKASAEEYFANLNQISAALSQIGTQIEGINGNYAKKIIAFYEALQ